MARRGRKTSFKFQFSPEDYWTQNLTKGSLTEPQMRQEYTRARSVANKRIKRLSASDFATSDVVANHAEGFKTLNSIKSRRELIRELSDVHRFLESQYSSIQGQQMLMDNNIATMQSHGYDFINEKNYKSFVNFMEDARSRVVASGYGSEFFVDIFEQSERLKISAKSLLKDVDYWAKHLEELRSVDKNWLDRKMDRKGNRRVSAARLKESLGYDE